jgi:hypothetical protein
MQINESKDRRKTNKWRMSNIGRTDEKKMEITAALCSSSVWLMSRVSIIQLNSILDILLRGFSLPTAQEPD